MFLDAETIALHLIPWYEYGLSTCPRNIFSGFDRNNAILFISANKKLNHRKFVYEATCFLHIRTVFFSSTIQDLKVFKSPLLMYDRRQLLSGSGRSTLS